MEICLFTLLTFHFTLAFQELDRDRRAYKKLSDINMTQSLLWVTINLSLAFAPVLLAWVVCYLARKSKKNQVLKVPMVVFGVLWLLFLPNSCYLLTEWRHFLWGMDSSNLFVRSELNSVLRLKLMIYTIYYLCYSGIGMLAFTLAIRPIAALAKRNGATLWVHGMWLFLLTSLGVYLGLKPRFNSWDFIARPSEILAFIVEIGRHPLLSAFIVAFAGFLWLSYFGIDTWIDGFLGRLGKKSSEPNA